LLLLFGLDMTSTRLGCVYTVLLADIYKCPDSPLVMCRLQAVVELLIGLLLVVL
jgi:hypothetical protein